MSASLAPTQPQTPTPEPVVTPGIVVKTSEAAPVEAPPSPRASKAGRADGARAALAPAWQVKASPAELTSEMVSAVVRGIIFLATNRPFIMYK